MTVQALTNISNYHYNPIVNNLTVGLNKMKKYKVKNCKQCNAEFLPTNSAHNFCGNECKFWNYTNKTEDKDSCWLWKRKPNIYGYGHFHEQGQKIGAHRYSYTMNVGIIPKDLLVCHHCDVPLCVNPSHLFVGSSLDNKIDCVQKARHHKKLSIDIVKCIMTDQRSNEEIAKEYNITKGSVSGIKVGRHWKYIEGERIAKGQVRGERNPAAKLNAEQVIAIRNDKRTIRVIANDYAVGSTVISSIKTGLTWKHIEGELDCRGDLVTHRSGEDNPGCKYSDELVCSVRASNSTPGEIAIEYNIPISVVYYLRYNKTRIDLKGGSNVRKKS